jgi:pimeloyl-ACP methyl ester carboxylesterase
MTYTFRPLLLLSFVLLFASSAIAGPPLICHPFEIGTAPSLPWNGASWSAVDPKYDVARLVDDTLSALTPDTPVLVRMETLRRATVYARSDGAQAAQLLARLHERLARKDRSSREYALALFDVGYLTETYKQAAWISANAHEDFWNFKQPNPKENGYAQITHAIAMTGDPAMEFAAAVVASDRRVYGQTAYREHLTRAVAATPDGSLLARNLAAHFGDAEIRDLRAAALKTR